MKSTEKYIEKSSSSNPNDRFSLQAIYLKLNNYYHNHYGSSTMRSMIISIIPKEYSGLGTVFFSLVGSPPKGYALYIKDHMILRFCSPRGKCWKIWYNIRVPRIDNIISSANHDSLIYIYGNKSEINLKHFPNTIFLEFDENELLIRYNLSK